MIHQQNQRAFHGQRILARSKTHIENPNQKFYRTFRCLAVTHLVVYIIFALNHMILNEDINKYVQTETMTIA